MLIANHISTFKTHAYPFLRCTLTASPASRRGFYFNIWNGHYLAAWSVPRLQRHWMRFRSLLSDVFTLRLAQRASSFWSIAVFHGQLITLRPIALSYRVNHIPSLFVKAPRSTCSSNRCTFCLTRSCLIHQPIHTKTIFHIHSEPCCLVRSLCCNPLCISRSLFFGIFASLFLTIRCITVPS